MNNKKSVLVIPHLFYPEVASTAQIYTELFHELENDFDITVLCAVPCYSGHIEDKYKIKGKEVYDEQYGNIKILRVPVKEFDKTNKKSRVKHIFSYYNNCKKQIAKLGHFDVTFVCSQPPIIGGMLGVYSKKKNHSKLIYNIQDFNPEQAEAVMSKKLKPAFDLMKKIDKKSCEKADEVIVVGRDMVETLKNRFKDKNVPKYTVINNWIDEKQIYPLPTDHPKVLEFKKKYGLENKFVFMYSGNIGLYYDLVNIAKTINDLPKNLKTKTGRDVVFAFVGAGSALSDVKEVLKNNSNAMFIPYQPKEELIYSLNAADVHLCVNAKGIKGVSVPSKCYGIMAVAKPILGVLENGSECEQIISNSKCGICSEPKVYDKLKENILFFIDNDDNISKLGINGWLYLQDKFTKNISIVKYRNIFFEKGGKNEKL